MGTGMRFADESGVLTWAEMGWDYPAATVKRGGVWVDPLGFSTAEARAEYDLMLAEEEAAKAHAAFMASQGRAPDGSPLPEVAS